MTYLGWFDDRKIPLPQKIRDAMKFHERKYGTPPNIVEIPLSEENASGIEIEVLRVKELPSFHYLLGVKE